MIPVEQRLWCAEWFVRWFYACIITGMPRLSPIGMQIRDAVDSRKAADGADEMLAVSKRLGLDVATTIMAHVTCLCALTITLEERHPELGETMRNAIANFVSEVIRTL